MTTDRDGFPERFEVPGFVSESRPEIQQVRSVSHGTTTPAFFARFRHDQPNLGVIEPTPLADQIMVAVELRPLRPTNVFCDGRHVRKPRSESGALALYDLRKSWSADLKDPFDNVSVYLPLSSFQDFAEERGNSLIELVYDVREVRYDAVMLYLMCAMLPALERPQEVDSLYLDSMSLAMRDHIASAYGTFKIKIADYKCNLTTRQLRHALEYIEANLSEDVSLADVANASAASVSSLTRGFKVSLGISPHNWLVNRRIALAQRLIYSGDSPLSEVAACCGFADQSHLTRVFIRKIGSSPAAWRRKAQR